MIFHVIFSDQLTKPTLVSSFSLYSFFTSVYFKYIRKLFGLSPLKIVQYSSSYENFLTMLGPLNSVIMFHHFEEPTWAATGQFPSLVICIPGASDRVWDWWYRWENSLRWMVYRFGMGKKFLGAQASGRRVLREFNF